MKIYWIPVFTGMTSTGLFRHSCPDFHRAKLYQESRDLFACQIRFYEVPLAWERLLSHLSLIACETLLLPLH